MNYELNRALLNELIKTDIDPSAVSSLMSEGADPLGYYDEDEEESVITSLIMDICDAAASEKETAETYKGFKEKLAVLLDNGLDLSKLQDSSKTDDPAELWSMSFLNPEYTYEILELLIKKNVPVNAIEDYVEHSYTDLWLTCSLESLTEYPEHAKEIYRSIFFVASFSEVLDSSDYIKDLIEMDLNGNKKDNLSMFRNRDEIDVFFDVSTKDDSTVTLRGTTITLVHIPASRTVWITHI